MGRRSLPYFRTYSSGETHPLYSI